jgi:hypothetical protein
VTETLIRPPSILTPTADSAPVELAAVAGIVDMHEPETYLMFTFNRPDGGAHCWDAWTEGGRPLGDDIDARAVAAGFDGADWIEISERTVVRSERGRIDIQAYPLRAVLAAIEGGVRADEGFRYRFRRAVHEMRPDSPVAALLPWLGFGPCQVGRRS